MRSNRIPRIFVLRLKIPAPGKFGNTRSGVISMSGNKDSMIRHVQDGKKLKFPIPSLSVVPALLHYHFRNTKYRNKSAYLFLTERLPAFPHSWCISFKPRKDTSFADSGLCSQNFVLDRHCFRKSYLFTICRSLSCDDSPHALPYGRASTRNRLVHQWGVPFFGVMDSSKSYTFYAQPASPPIASVFEAWYQSRTKRSMVNPIYDRSFLCALRFHDLLLYMQHSGVCN